MANEIFDQLEPLGFTIAVTRLNGRGFLVLAYHPDDAKGAVEHVIAWRTRI